MTSKKEEIKATVLIYKNAEYSVEVPSNECWENGIEAIFIISFKTSFEKQRFLKQYQKKDFFHIGLYIYSNCKVRSINHTNMIKCHALKQYDDSNILNDFFNGEIPF